MWLQWRVSSEDPPLNQRSFSLFPPDRFRRHACGRLPARGERGRPAGGIAADAPVARRQAKHPGHGRGRPGIRRPGRSRQHVSADHLAGSRRGDRVLPGPEHPVDAQPDARLGGRKAGVAAGAADPLGQPLAGAAGVHQPRSWADLRNAPRSAAAVAAGCRRRSARAADHSGGRELGRRDAVHLRRHSPGSKRDLAGDRTPHRAVRGRRTRCDAAPGTAQGLVQGLRLVDPSSIVIDLGPRYASFRASNQTTGNTARLVLDVLAAPVETANPPAPPTTPSEPPASELPVFGQQTAAIRTVAIDAGHGGDDVGARGESGTVEKDLTLAVARRVKAAHRGAARHPRADDARRRSQHPAERADRAGEQQQGRHLHQPSRERVAACRRRPAPLSTWPRSRIRVRRRPRSLPERVPVFGGGSRDIELVLWDFAQIRHIDQSAELARILEETLRERVHARSPADRARPVPRARVGEHAGGARRDGIPHQSRTGKAAGGRASFRPPSRRRARRHRPVPRPPGRDGQRTVKPAAVRGAGAHRARGRRPAPGCFSSGCRAAIESDAGAVGGPSPQPRRRRRGARSRRGCSTSPTTACR